MLIVLLVAALSSGSDDDENEMTWNGSSNANGNTESVVIAGVGILLFFKFFLEYLIFELFFDYWKLYSCTWLGLSYRYVLVLSSFLVFCFFCLHLLCSLCFSSN